jgi:DNA-binding SARP family transcriptional activator/tetratricopeptide (TPR) repeat protein
MAEAGSSAMHHGIGLRLLGPVTLRAGAGWASPGTPQQRMTLAMLALSAGQVVPVPELIDAIWEERPPRSARASLHSLMTRVRQSLAGIPGAAVDRCGDGYRLRVDLARVDLHRFRALARAGRDAAEDQAAIALFDEALGLWRGPAMADVPATAAAEMLRAALAEEQLAAAADRVGCLLACGREREAAAELPSLLAASPLSERLAGLLMVARYRCGRRGEALQVFRDIRRRLAAELGVEPAVELQRLHERILAGDQDHLPGSARPAAGRHPGTRQPAGHGPWPLPAPGPGRAARPVPRQLPPAAANFVARSGELRLMDEMVTAGGTDTAAPVLVICGPAGVGKTTLAVRWAHRAVPDFPDGQLYLNLMGFSPSVPVAPEQAIRGLLQAVGVPSPEIPESVPAQAALYRSMLAGRRMLVLLDNAADASQVRSLLPGGQGCVVLVTSRSQLTGLVATEGAKLLSLDMLAEADARELLAGRLGGQRVAAEPGGAGELARLCGGLPLALVVVAARAAAQPWLPLSAVAAGLRRRPDRLDALETGDRGSTVREVFSWSCRQLSPPALRMFRLVGIHPGPDISARAAASLAGLPEQQAGRALAELVRANMLAEHAAERYSCHDLLRAYAAEQAERCDPAERDAAVRRVLDHYLHTATAAARLLYPASDPLPAEPAQPAAVPLPPAERSQALSWFSAEHQVLLTAAGHAVAAGLDARAWKLVAAMTDFLNREGHWHDLATVGGTALAAADRLGDRHGQAHARYSLGTACLGLGRHREGLAHLELAAAAFRLLGDTARQARSKLAVGEVLRQQGRHAAARRQAELALRMYTELGNRRGQARALTNLGWHITQLGDYPGALVRCERALALHREFGNLLGEAHTWDHLGYARHQMGQDTDAISCYRRALRLLRVVSDRLEQAGVLARLGDALGAVGNRQAAHDAWRRSLAILDELHHPYAPQVRSRMRDAAAVAIGAG